MDAVEVAPDAERVGGLGVPEPLVERRQERVALERALDLEPPIGAEVGQHRERAAALGLDRVQVPVHVGAQELSVERDHLAVAGIEGPEPEVSMLGELLEADVAVVRAVQQRLDRRGLEQQVRIVLGVELASVQRLHVERLHQPLVDRAHDRVPRHTHHMNSPCTGSRANSAPPRDVRVALRVHSHVDVGGEDPDQGRDQPPPRDPPPAGDDRGHSSGDLRGPACRHHLPVRREVVGDDRLVPLAPREVHHAGEDEERSQGAAGKRASHGTESIAL